MQAIISAAVPVSMFIVITVITDIVLKYKIKKHAINLGVTNQDFFKSVFSSNIMKLSSLKWGLILLFGGIGLIVIGSGEYSQNSPIPYGIFFISISIGFILYYFIVRNVKD